MSKNLMIASAVLIALALFWKPIQDMINGITGGGGGLDGSYGGSGAGQPYYTSTDDPSKFSPPPETPPETPPSTPNTSETSSVAPWEDPANQGGDPAKITTEATDTNSLLQSAGEGVAWVGGTVIATKTINTLTKGKAFSKAKDVATKAKPLANKFLQAGKNAINKPIGKRALLGGAITLATTGAIMASQNIFEKEKAKGVYSKDATWGGTLVQGIKDIFKGDIWKKEGFGTPGYTNSGKNSGKKGGSAPSKPYNPNTNTRAATIIDTKSGRGSGGLGGSSGGTYTQIGNIDSHGKVWTGPPPVPVRIVPKSPPPPPSGGKKK